MFKKEELWWLGGMLLEGYGTSLSGPRSFQRPQNGRKSIPLCFIAHSYGQVAEKKQEEKRRLCSSEEGVLVELGSLHDL